MVLPEQAVIDLTIEVRPNARFDKGNEYTRRLMRVPASGHRLQLAPHDC
jgi:hypothetical protein